MVELANAVFGRGGGLEMGSAFPTLFHPDNADWLRTFWDGDRAVSHVGIWRGHVWTHGRRLAVAHVGAVCTRPEYRSQGLAWGLLVDALTRLQADGVALLFISGDRSLYRRLGARPFGALLKYRVTGAALQGLRHEATSVVPEAGPERLMPVYGAEPLRYERSAREWHLLLPGRGYVGDRQPLVADDGAAYLLPGKADHGILSVDEFAGPRPAVLAALPAALARAGAEAADLRVQQEDAEMQALLAEADLVPGAVRHQGTIRVLNPRACAEGLSIPQPPAWPGAIGDPTEAEAAARWTEWLFGPGGLTLPRNDGLNYI